MPGIRAVAMVLVLGLVVMDCCAESLIQKINATVGEDVLLPCPCTKETVVVVWQIDTTVVNYYGTEEVNESKQSKIYRGRSRIILTMENKSCALSLFNVTFSDQKTFTCYVYVKNDQKTFVLEQPFSVELKVFEAANSTVPNGTLQGDPSTNDPSRLQKNLSVGVPLSLILIILVVVFMAFIIRKHRCNTKQMV